MNLPALADFNLVAKHGGFGRASRITGRPKASLSRRVMELEESLGVRLFERGTRSLTLTDEGAALFSRTEGLLAEIHDVGETIGAGLIRPTGLLRISAPLLFAQLVMGKLAAKFVAQYPEVRIEVTADDRLIDPIEERYDIVIRTNPRPDNALVGRRFIVDHLVVAAAPSLAPPIDSTIDNAVNVPAVSLSDITEGTLWNFVNVEKKFSIRPKQVLWLASMYMVRDAAIAGAGVAILPRAFIEAELANGQLHCWGDVTDRKVDIWVLHISRRLVSTKVSAFVNFLCNEFPNGSLGDFLKKH